MEPEPSVCVACSYSITSLTERMSHYKSPWHRYNVKRRCASLPPVTETDFTIKLDAVKRLKDDKISDSKFSCDSCRKGFQNEKAYQQHLNSKKHKKGEAYISKRQNESTSSASEKVVDTVPQSSAEQKTEGGMQNVTNVQMNVVKDEGPDAEDAEDEEEVDVFDGKEGIPLKHCLFCAQNFQELDPCLQHMNSKHGFFIPYTEFLHDLNGLLLYLGEKIAIGHVCLYCNGRGRAAYSSLYAVQQHMIDKGHCKMRFEEDDEDDEFCEFYKFPGDEEDVQMSDDKRVVVSRGAVEVTPIGELVLGDGTVLGHRALLPYYKQNLKPDSDTSSPLPGHLKALQLPGYARPTAYTAMDRKIFQRYSRNQLKVGMIGNNQSHFRKQMNV